MVELYRRKTHISTKKFVFFCVKKEYDLCNFVSVLQKKLKLRTFFYFLNRFLNQKLKKTRLCAAKKAEYIWDFCVDSIKNNAKTKKEERNGKVGTVKKADLKLI